MDAEFKPSVRQACARGWMTMNGQYYNTQFTIDTTGKITAMWDDGKGGSQYNVGTNYACYGQIIYVQ